MAQYNDYGNDEKSYPGQQRPNKSDPRKPMHNPDFPDEEYPGYDERPSRDNPDHQKPFRNNEKRIV